MVHMVGIKSLFKKKSNGLEEKQKANTAAITKNLSNVRNVLDRLIRTTDEVTDIRALRNRFTSLISDFQGAGFGNFGRKSTSLDEFYAGEDLLIECTDNLLDTLEQTKDNVDIVAITHLIEAVEDSVNNRVPVTEELNKLYFEGITEKQKAKQEVPDSASSELTLYLNMLHTKYASSKPDVLHTGDYFPMLKWEYRTGNKSISAQLSHG